MDASRGSHSGGYKYRHFGAFRLLLATLVMLQHFAADLAPPAMAAAFAPYAVGSMAVMVFFALSGFVITEAVDQVYRDRPGAFLTNRLLRILPHFLVAVALAMIVHEVFRAAGGVRLWRSQPSFPDNAFALPNVLMNFVAVVPVSDRLIDYNFLDIAWAVRVEMAFYLSIFACIVLSRRISWTHGFAGCAVGLLLVTAPLSYLAINGRGIAMLAYTPYFAFGGGLYFATKASRAGWLTVLLSIPLMLWQYTAQQAALAPFRSIPLFWHANLIILIVLLASMTILASATITRYRRTDRALGNLTYPLYLYHESVLVVMLTFTTGYAYRFFTAGILFSVITAVGLMAMLDPMVARYRDRIRGVTIQFHRASAQDLRPEIVRSL